MYNNSKYLYLLDKPYILKQIKNTGLNIYNDDDIYNYIIKNPKIIINNPSLPIGVLKDIINEDPMNILLVEEPDIEHLILAIDKDPSIIQYFTNLEESLLVYALTKDPSAIKYINNPSPTLCMIAVNINPLSLEYIDRQTDEISQLAILKNTDTMKYVDVLSIKSSLTALIQDNTILFNLSKSFRESIINILLKI